MGDQLRSGPVKYLHLKNVDCTNPGNVIVGSIVTGEAASVQAGQRCFRLEMGLQGALAREQDEYPIQINIGNTSQSAVVDCDPDKPNLKQEIEEGCGTPDGFPSYTSHDFAQTDGSGTPYCPDLNSAGQFFSLPSRRRTTTGRRSRAYSRRPQPRRTRSPRALTSGSSASRTTRAARPTPRCSDRAATTGTTRTTRTRAIRMAAAR